MALAVKGWSGLLRSLREGSPRRTQAPTGGRGFGQDVEASRFRMTRYQAV